MNRGFLAFTSFLVGGAVGAFITWKAIDKYYADLAEEEIQSVKERYYGEEKNSYQEESNDKEHKREQYPNKTNDIHEYAKLLSKEQYVDYQKNDTESLDEEDDDTYDIYVISPDEYGDKVGTEEWTDWELEGLVYFQDGVLCDERDNPIQEVELTVGRDWVTKFGYYGYEDVVHVRNEGLKTDYEIVKDYRNYRDIIEDRGA